MKDPIKNIELSFACPENWENMKDIGNNRYCEKCQHLVVDFTKLTQQEFNDAVKNAPGRLCGRFRQSQMSNRFLKYAAATAMVASVLTPTSCMEEEVLPAGQQTPPPMEEPVEENEGSILTGVIIIPDSLILDPDPTIFEQPSDEGEYPKEE